ncbi:alpha/beta hydrolase [Pedobacter polaris]|uniref:Alpha/beta hydrolase n=2 Tax=Pedobacter polaris TaxID=2571273 RepID=A0A4U1CWY5_9SPHI|nr:alpha/beta hydrolase [Pedobacter polaris]
MKAIKLVILLMVMANHLAQAQDTGKYATVNGLKMYYEIHGTGSPLVLIHGGGSTIYTNFGRIIPFLAKTHQVIAVELQAHGHSGDRAAPETFQQDADDVAALLKHLNIAKADIFGFSNGGQTTMEIGMRHPNMVNKLIVASAFYKRDGAPAGFWEMMANAKFSDMPQVYKDEFLKVNNNPAALMNMFTKDSQRMQNFKDWKAADLKAIKAPVLVLIGDQDLPTPEHAVEMYRLFEKGRLAILPGTHGSYLGEIMTSNPNLETLQYFTAVLNEFLAAK